MEATIRSIMLEAIMLNLDGGYWECYVGQRLLGEVMMRLCWIWRVGVL
jgi:cytochrome b